MQEEQAEGLVRTGHPVGVGGEGGIHRVDREIDQFEHVLDRLGQARAAFAVRQLADDRPLEHSGALGHEVDRHTDPGVDLTGALLSGDHLLRARVDIEQSAQPACQHRPLPRPDQVEIEQLARLLVGEHVFVEDAREAFGMSGDELSDPLAGLVAHGADDVLPGMGIVARGMGTIHDSVRQDGTTVRTYQHRTSKVAASRFISLKREGGRQPT